MFTSLSLSPTWEKDSQHLLHAPVEINPGFWTSPVPYFGCKLGLFDQPSSKTFQPQLLKSQICCNQFLLVSKKNPSEKKKPQPSTDFYFKPIISFKAHPKKYGKKPPKSSSTLKNLCDPSWAGENSSSMASMVRFLLNLFPLENASCLLPCFAFKTHIKNAPKKILRSASNVHPEDSFNEMAWKSRGTTTKQLRSSELKSTNFMSKLKFWQPPSAFSCLEGSICH